MSVGESGSRRVGGRYPLQLNLATFRYSGPWHARIAITFVLIYIFTRGFLQRFKHRIDNILSL